MGNRRKKALRNEDGMNGIFYPAFNNIVLLAQKLSVVEWVKAAAIFLFNAKSPEEKRKVANYAIDFFIAAKWGFLLLVLILGLNSTTITIIVFYLLAMNFITYFWYHLWVYEKNKPMTPERERRRFINLFAAYCFSIVGFSYIYSTVIPNEFLWPSQSDVRISSLFFSIGSPVTKFYGEAEAITLRASVVTWVQAFITLVFVSILLNNSIPKIKE